MIDGQDAVPDHRFRDQLAEAIPAWAGLTHDEPTLLAAALLPTVQALIAAELRVVADNVRKQAPGYIGRIDTADSIDDRAAALAPSGKQEVNQKQ